MTSVEERLRALEQAAKKYRNAVGSFHGQLDAYRVWTSDDDVTDAEQMVAVYQHRLDELLAGVVDDEDEEE